MRFQTHPITKIIIIQTVIQIASQNQTVTTTTHKVTLLKQIGTEPSSIQKRNRVSRREKEKLEPIQDWYATRTVSEVQR
jgi:hypothetical protein